MSTKLFVYGQNFVREHTRYYMNKTCSVCNEEKDRSEFLKHGGTRCKSCYNAYKRENGFNKYSRRAVYFSNYQKDLRKTDGNKKYEKDFRKSYHASFSGTVGRLLSGARTRAKNFGLEMDLDREWIESHLEAMRCEATGAELVLEIDESVQQTAFRPSIDRINNSKGYTKENCRIVCVIYNKAKSDYDDSDVMKMARALLERNQE